VEEAIDEYRAARRLDPRSEIPPARLGRLLFERRRYDEALPMLEEAIRLNPKDMGSTLRLGRIHLACARRDEAVRLFETAERLDPTWPEARTLLRQARGGDGSFSG
jgi:tetratricopeptide (TPR) repeat protein